MRFCVTTCLGPLGRSARVLPSPHFVDSKRRDRCTVRTIESHQSLRVQRCHLWESSLCGETVTRNICRKELTLKFEKRAFRALSPDAVCWKVSNRSLSEAGLGTLGLKGRNTMTSDQAGSQGLHEACIVSQN